tara:strand:+ start:994 stop:1716 length:723 start_codon:yes stop_codon:yes gene_type:complete
MTTIPVRETIGDPTLGDDEPLPPPRREVVISETTHRRVVNRAHRLARVFGLDRATRDDVLQQLWLRAVRAAEQYEQNRGATEDHFIRLHLDFEYRDLRREFLAEREGSRHPPMHAPSPTPDHRPGCDLRMDIDSFLGDLPEDLAAIASGLRYLTVAQVAAECGLHRGTVYRKLVTLRRALEDFLKIEDFARDRTTSENERSACAEGASDPASNNRSQPVQPEPSPVPPPDAAHPAEGGLA